VKRAVMLVLLALAPATWASTEVETAANYASHPDDALLRLEFAQEMARVSDHEEEAHIGLEALLANPAVGSAARASLIDLCTRNPARAGWERTYQGLIDGPWESPDDPRRYRLQLRMARLDVEDPGLREEAVATLRELMTVWPDDPEPRLAVAHAHMLSGEPAAVLDVIADGGSAETRMRALASVALPTASPEYLQDLTPVAVDAEDALATALREPSPLNRARALDEAGYPELAIEVLWVVDDATAQPDTTLPRDGVVLKELGRLMLKVDRFGDAQQVYEAAIKIDPLDDEARIGYARSLWTAGQHERALTSIDEVSSEAARAMYAEHLVLEAERDARTPEEIAATARAYELTPDNPLVARHHGRALAAQGQYAEAVYPLLSAVAANPTDVESLSLLLESLTDSGDPSRALPLLRRALGLTEPPMERTQLQNQLFTGLVRAGEIYKDKNDTEQAILHYALAALIEPNDVPALLGLGGLWWHMDELERAETVFFTAHRLDKTNPDAIENLFAISLAKADIERARAWLREAPSGNEARFRPLWIRLELEATLQEAREARKMGDQERAVRAYQSLSALYPQNATVSHELGDAFLEAGQPEEALKTYRAALEVDPTNEWAILGEVNALILLDQIEKALDRLALLDSSTQPKLVEEAEKARARLHQANGDRLRDEGDDHGAFSEYAKAMNLIPDTWSLTALGWLYYEHEQHVSAIAFFTEALEYDGDNNVARRGRVFALSRSGNLAQATAEAAALAIEHPSRENRELIDELRFQTEFERAMAARGRGDYDEARVILTAAGATRPEDTDVGAALAALLQDEGQSGHAMARAALVLDVDPTNEFAVATLLAAAHDLDQHDKAEPILRRAAEEGGGVAVRKGLRIAELQIKLSDARELHAMGQTELGLEKVGAAERGTGNTPDSLALIGGAYLDLGAPRDSIRAFNAALASDPEHVQAILGRVGALRALGRPWEADEYVQGQFKVTEDPEIGLAYADLLREQGRKKRAREILEEVILDAGRLPIADEATSDPLPLVALPSGRASYLLTMPSPQEREYDLIAIDPVLQSRVDVLRGNLAGSRPPTITVMPEGVARPGFAGMQYLAALSMPIVVQNVVAGPLHLSAEVLPLSLNDGVHQEAGAAFTGGISTSPRRPWGFRAHLGFSPAGFTGAPYPTWFTQVRGQIDDTFLGIETARAPATDSLMSWAGVEDLDTEQVIGRVSKTWFGGYVRVRADADNDAGGAGRAGWLDILGGRSVPFGEVSLWADRLVTEGKPALHLGMEGVISTYGRQVDGFTPGMGGTFTPPLYASAFVRAKGEMEDLLQKSVWLAWNAGLGPQYLLGDDTVFFGAGMHMGGEAMGSVSYRVSKALRIGFDLRYQVTFGEWYQVSTAARIDYSRGFGSARPTPNTGLSPTFGESVVNAQATRPR